MVQRLIIDTDPGVDEMVAIIAAVQCPEIDLLALTTVGGTVFAAGIAMAPVFPTTLGMVGDAFPKGTATAMGFVITFGWVGLAVSSRIIGALGGSDPKQLPTALMVLPAASALMVVIMLVLRGMTPKKA